MRSPDQPEVNNVYEVRFKNTRKGFYRNGHGLRLFLGDPVVVESDRGFDIGHLALGGVVAELQMRKKKYVKDIKDVPRIFRKANESDIELLKIVRERESETRTEARKIIEELRLDMKLTDVEFQGDNTKAIFYYIADHRVDFRELIKRLARQFRIRVEMKQIGLRHEAGLVGGIGSCGRELCCSTWLTEFKTVSTSAARYQNLSLNPMKISGLCGRLKCCLNFELDAYMDALSDFPKTDRLETQMGRAFLQKTDIFKRKMWFSYEGEASWYPLEVDQVKEIIAMNKKGELPEKLVAAPTTNLPGASPVEFDFVDVVGQFRQTEPSDRRGRGNKGRKNTKNQRRNTSDRRGNQQRNKQGGNPSGGGRNQNSQKSSPQQKPSSRRNGNNKNRRPK
ncbi:MAG: regulatory iron-sulfur-containing complex subunit RicT [Bacteroidota bacterium]